MFLKDRNGEIRCEVKDPDRDLLMETDAFRLYLADGCLLRLAKDQFQNGIINAEAELLERVAERAAEFDQLAEEKYHQKVHYDWLVPRLEATFLTDASQGSRQANLLSFPDVEISELVPLPKLQNFCDVDCKTAAWVIGRFLKLQTFLERSDIVYELNPVHTLICPSRHRVIYLGLGLSLVENASSDGLINIIRNGNVKTAARQVLSWIHPEDPQETRGLPVDAETSGKLEFIDFLRDLSVNGRKDGVEAHRDLYTLIERIWGAKYHPFTYYVKSEAIWRQDDRIIAELSAKTKPEDP